MNMNICIFVGARPNFIKIAPIVRAVVKAKAEGKSVSHSLVYAGREDDPTLEPSLFDDLQIGRPDVCLGVECKNLNELTGQVMSAFECYLQEHKTDVVIVVDDLASTMAAAIVAKKQGIRLAHLVAGTRSFDISMPKEINRLVIDGLSDLLFTAGIGGNSAATREGAESSKIYMVGNILMDTLRFNHQRFARPAVMDSLGLTEKRYIVFTLNRKAIIGNDDELRALLVSMMSHTGDIPVVAPLRQLAADAVQCIVNENPLLFENLHIVEPLDYLHFGYLTANALGVVTDSGNVAEEATFNTVPCITLNSYTEHIETVKVGSNVLVGEDPVLLGEEMARMVDGKWKHCGIPERWDGRSAERIVQTLLECAAK
jgi:UDP-N-acetylglucosamine 2-epimerase (non-hydrolysing)